MKICGAYMLAEWMQNTHLGWCLQDSGTNNELIMDFHNFMVLFRCTGNRQGVYHEFSKCSDLHHFNLDLDLLEIRELQKESARHDRRPLPTRTLMTLSMTIRLLMQILSSSAEQID